MKKLNNKGFTLIELLAVVVILAVVMGIAMTNVLSSMNKARAGSLQDTAQVIANAFNQKYTESLVGGVPTSVYGDVAGFSGYDFSKTATYYIDDKLADTFNISGSTYLLENSASSDYDNRLTASDTPITSSFVSYDAATGKFVVCIMANRSGSNYVTGFAMKSAAKLSAISADNTNSGGGVASTDTNYNGLTLGAGAMLACNDGTRTWK